MNDPTKTLAFNLAALQRRNPELAARLAEPVRSDHLRIDDEGWALRHGRSWLSLGLDVERIQSLTLPISDLGVLIIGIGAGELVEHALAEQQGLPRVYAWEPDAWSLRLALSYNDWSKDLTSGRLRLALGSDLLRQDRTLPRWEHPVLARLYARELAAFLHTGERVLMVAGELGVTGLVSALRRTGVEAWTLHATRDSVRELERTVQVVGAHRIYSINYVEGLAEFAHEHALELFVWEIDPSTAPPRPVTTSTQRTHVFCHRRANVATWRAAGYVHVDYLPLAADPGSRRPYAREDVELRYRSALSFVGSSLASNALDCRARFLDGLESEFRLAPNLVDEVLTRLLGMQAEEHDEYLLPELWSGSPFAANGPSTLRGEDPVMLVAEIAASQRRIAEARSVADLGLAVWGDEGWGLAPELDYRGPAGHHDELDQIVAGSDLVLDLGRLYQADIVTLRVFDSLALERAVLTPENGAIAELFEPGREVLTYRTRADMRERVCWALDHLDEVDAIARRGRERVVREHTYDHRLATMHASASRVLAA